MSNEERKKLIGILESNNKLIRQLLEGETSVQPPEIPESPRFPFNRLLKFRAEELGMSQSALIRATGISKASMSKYFSGSQSPGSEHLAKILDALGCTSVEFCNTREVHRDKSVPVKLRKITVTELAKWISKTEQQIRVELQTGAAEYGRAYKGGGNKWVYEIYPGMVKMLFGIDFLAMWRNNEAA
jgi:transcriptional regulator with XRE-family HTH domain